jgi:ABC-2 type transport system ATP-binding protein
MTTADSMPPHLNLRAGPQYLAGKDIGRPGDGNHALASSRGVNDEKRDPGLPDAAPAIEIRNLEHWYGQRRALADVTFSIRAGELFGLLGPNGGGKTTLFRIVATLMRPTAGSVTLCGHDVLTSPGLARRHMGIVFQAPALDGQLTVTENLRHHGHLYGLHGRELGRRMALVIERVRLGDRAHEEVHRLSGGLRRRAELAKAMLPNPSVLVLDEPSVGLDPTARREFGNDLALLRDRDGTTVMLTTHLMDEAAQCDRVGILHEGRLVAYGTPDSLIEEIGGDVILIRAKDPQALASRIRERFRLVAEVVDDQIRIEQRRGHELIPHLIEAFSGEIHAATVGKPTLDDVFVHHTGHHL